MSRTKRYKSKTMGPGDWVKYSDYAALAAENERLRKAGDELANDLFSRISMRSETPRTIKNWYAAKEGRDAK